MTQLTGRTFGQYHIIEKIGQGGMATVYKAYQSGLERNVALKVMLPLLAGQPGFSQRFQREAKAIANLHHANILPVYDFCREPYSFIVMRYIEGNRTLREFMANPLPLSQMVDLLGQVAAALEHSHRQGILHRDVKPSNVLLDRDGEWALLADFGLAKMMEDSVKLTGGGLGVGTPAYMSPEQGQTQKVDHRTDIYALGIILFEMLTGQIPHKANTPMAIIAKRATEPLPLPRSLNPAISESLEQVILKALAPTPAERFVSAEAFAVALESAMSDSVTGVYKTPPDGVEQPTIPTPKIVTPSHLPPEQPADLLQGVPARPQTVEQTSTLPKIDLANKIQFPPNHKDAFVYILQTMFPAHQRIIIAKDFADQSFSGSWVYLVHLIQDGTPNLPVVVKIASCSLIAKEWQAYNQYIRDRWPFTAAIKDQPVVTTDGSLSGLYYSVVGDDVFPVQSLGSYCLAETTTVAHIQAVLKRFTRVIKRARRFSSKSPKFRLRASYDTVLPVNLLLNPTAPLPAEGVVVVTSSQSLIRGLSLDPGNYVRLQDFDFAVTKVDLKQKTVTLNLPRPSTTKHMPRNSYSIRLKFKTDSAMPTYEMGQRLSCIEGQIIETRSSQWQAKMKEVMAAPAYPEQSQKDFDLTCQTVSLSDGRQLPNPFVAVPHILERLYDIKVDYIHGDMNLENILVDPEVRNIRLIDFAEARQDHILHDFLRMETEVVTKLLPPALLNADLSGETVSRFYKQLHRATFGLPKTTSPLDTIRLPDPTLEKPFALLKSIREAVRDQALFERDKYAEYYHCLILYLLGTLKFRNLDRLAKQSAFWGAATLVALLENPSALPTVQEVFSPPPALPQFDLNLLEDLDAPGGAVMLHDKFYIKREADEVLARQIVKSRAITTIRAPRQTGKSSLLARGINAAAEAGTRVVPLNLQGIDRANLETLPIFLRYLAEYLVRKLKLDEVNVDDVWSNLWGPQDNLTNLLESHILPQSDTLLLLAMDEVDILLETPFHNDFFGMVRGWYNSGAYEPQWQKLNIVMVISTEPNLLITDVYQSPFNVGLRLNLADFDEAQVSDLNQHHGLCLPEDDLPALMMLLHGHPYLVRQAFYSMITNRWQWADLQRQAVSDHGPFGDHLRYQHSLLAHKPALQKALKQVIAGKSGADEMALSRLLRAGLVRDCDDGTYCCRCDLYRQYFKGRVA